jgi:hypothetical protein
MDEIQESLAGPAKDDLPVAASTEVAPPGTVASPVKSTYKPFVYHFVDVKPAANPATFITAILAVVTGLMVGYLGHWLLQAGWWASIALFGAAACSTMILAASRKNKIYMWAWVLTIPGLAWFTYLALHLLPAIAVTHLTGYLLIAARFVGVMATILVLPLPLLYVAGVKPNRGLVRTMAWCGEQLLWRIQWAILGVLRISWALAKWLGNLLVKRQASPAPVVTVIVQVIAETRPSWVGVTIGF